MTIYDIAKEAGVSASTVSRVINNRPGIKDETREKIKLLLAKYHYQPNASAQGLSNGDSKMIGILVTDLRTTHHTGGAYVIEQYFRKFGYSSLILNTGSDKMSKRRCIESLSNRRVSAVAMIGSVFQDDDIASCIANYLSNIPVIISNGYLDMPNVYSVITDEKNGVEDCVRLLNSTGHGRIAFINEDDTTSNRSKELGYLEGIAKYCPGWLPVVSRVNKHESFDESQVITKSLIRNNPDIDSIIYATDLLAAGGLSGIRDLGLRVPEDISIIGINNSISAQICYPQLTSLDNKLEEMSTLCAKTLLGVLQGKKLSHKMMIKSNIVERGSTERVS